MENHAHIPYYAIIIIATLAGILSVSGSLNDLVDSASLIFLITFGIVNYIAFIQKVKYKYISLAGSIGCALSIIISSVIQFEKRPVPLIIIISIILLTIIGRPLVLKKISKTS